MGVVTFLFVGVLGVVTPDLLASLGLTRAEPFRVGRRDGLGIDILGKVLDTVAGLTRGAGRLATGLTGSFDDESVAASFGGTVTGIFCLLDKGSVETKTNQ